MTAPQQPPERDVLALARWLHTTSVATAVAAGESPDNYVPWQDMRAKGKSRYAAIARELLTNPPAAVRRAVRRLEG